MPYRYREDIARADAAFDAWGATPEEVFVAAADALLNVMVEDLGTVARRRERHLTAEAESLDLLLLGLLQELVYHKDVGSSRVDLQACKLEYSIVSPK